MKYTISFLLLFTSILSCTQNRQMEEEDNLGYNDLFMSRAQRAKTNMEQNYSSNPAPEASPVLEEAKQKEEEEEIENLHDVENEDFYYRTQNEDEELQEARDYEDENLYELEDEELQKEEEIPPLKKEKELYTPEEVRLWR